MAVTAFLYTRFLANVLGGATAGETRSIDILSDSIKMMLCSSSYVPDRDAHAFKSDITSEVASAGYAAGGIALTTKTLSLNSSSHTYTFDADDVIWTNAAIVARFAVLYDDGPSGDANKPLIGYIDFGTDRQSFQPGNFTVGFPAAGVFTLQGI